MASVSVLGKLGRCGLLVVNKLERFSRFPIRTKSTKNVRYNQLLKIKYPKHDNQGVFCGEEVLRTLPELMALPSKVKTVENNSSTISDIQNGQFNNLSTTVIIRCLDKLDDNQLNKVAQHLTRLREGSQDFLYLSEGLDKECCRRLPSWDWKTSFQILEECHRIKAGHLPKFRSQMAVRIEKLMLPESASTSNLLSFISSVKYVRSFPADFDKGLLLSRLYQLMDEFTIEELGVICEAFFMAKEPIRKIELCSKLASRLLDEIDTAGEDTINHILKVLRLSTIGIGNYSEIVLKLQPNLISHLHKWNSMTMIRLITVGTNILYFHPPSIEKVLELVMFGETQRTPHRLKDLERLAAIVAISNHRTNNTRSYWTYLEQELVKEERQKEIASHSRALLSLVGHCVTAGHYPLPLLHIVFQKDMIQSALMETSYNSTKRELLMLHHSVNIECPSYDGPRLSDENAFEYQKILQKPLPNYSNNSLSHHDRFLLDLLDTTLQLLGGSELAKVAYLQPHFILPDVTFRMDRQDRILPVTQWEDGQESQRIVLVAGARSLYRNMRSQEEPMGPLRFKMRQLGASGHRALLVPWHLFVPLSPEKRLSQLAQFLQPILKKKLLRM